MPRSFHVSPPRLRECVFKNLRGHCDVHSTRRWAFPSHTLSSTPSLSQAQPVTMRTRLCHLGYRCFLFVFAPFSRQTQGPIPEGRHQSAICHTCWVTYLARGSVSTRRSHLSRPPPGCPSPSPHPTVGRWEEPPRRRRAFLAELAQSGAPRGVTKAVRQQGPFQVPPHTHRVRASGEAKQPLLTRLQVTDTRRSESQGWQQGAQGARLQEVPAVPARPGRPAPGSGLRLRVRDLGPAFPACGLHSARSSG